MAARTIGIPELEGIILFKVHHGLKRAVERAAELYRKDAGHQERPIGPPWRNHAHPGQFPKRETGRAQASISSGVEGMVARFGLKQEGQYLYGWRTLGYLGMDHTFIAHLGAVTAAFKSGARLTSILGPLV